MIRRFLSTCRAPKSAIPRCLPAASIFCATAQHIGIYGLCITYASAARCIRLLGGPVCNCKSVLLLVVPSSVLPGRPSMRAYMVTYSAHQHTARRARIRAHATTLRLSQRTVKRAMQAYSYLSGWSVGELMWSLMAPASMLPAREPVRPPTSPPACCWAGQPATTPGAYAHEA